MNQRKYIIIGVFHILIFHELQTAHANACTEKSAGNRQQNKNFCSTCFIRRKESVLRCTLKTSKGLIENKRWDMQMV